MLLSLVKRNTDTQTYTRKHVKTIKETKTATTYNSSCLHHRWRYYQVIALNDQHIGPTTLALLPALLNDATR